MTAGDRLSPAALKIVVVEDTPELGASIAATLARAGFDPHVAPGVETGLRLARRLSAEMVLLEIGTPGMDAIDACRRLRTFSNAYVIMLTARSAEADRVAGLEAGADDYITKPFYARELVARIRGVERRLRSRVEVRRFGALEIDPDDQRVRLGEVAIPLSQTEYWLLNALSAHPGEILSRRELLNQIWGEAWFGSDHVIDVHVSNLRRKLGDDPHDPHYIATVRGLGFCMERRRTR